MQLINVNGNAANSLEMHIFKREIALISCVKEVTLFLLISVNISILF